MKNVYSTTLKLFLGIDAFVLFPTNDTNELLIYSHYTSERPLFLRSGTYNFDTSKKIIPIEGEAIIESTGSVFMPDAKNAFSNIKVKEITPSYIIIECDLFLLSEKDIIQLAFCDEYNQLFIAVAPITKENRKQSSTSGESSYKYFADYKAVKDSTVYKPFQF